MSYILKKCPVCGKMIHIHEKMDNNNAGRIYYQLKNLCVHFRRVKFGRFSTLTPDDDLSKMMLTSDEVDQFFKRSIAHRWG